VAERPHTTTAAGEPATRPPAAIIGYLRHLEVERRMAMNTLEAYRRDLERLARFAAAVGRPVTSLTRSDRAALRRPPPRGSSRPSAASSSSSG